MKKYNVQPRIYDSGKKFEGYPDRYSVYFPMPKKFRETRKTTREYTWDAPRRRMG